MWFWSPGLKGLFWVVYVVLITHYTTMVLCIITPSCIYSTLYISLPFTAGPTATIASFTHINASATRIQWTVDNLPQSRIINGYTLKYTATTTGSTLTVETAGQLNHAVLSGLMPFTEYTVLIRMRTVHGEGKWSNSRHFMTLPSGQCCLWMSNAWEMQRIHTYVHTYMYI